MPTPLIRLLQRLATACLWLCLCGLPALYAHGELHEQIENITESIAKDPTNPRLYLTRAELYRMHEQFDEALADLEIAGGLDATLDEIEFVRGKIYVDLKYRAAARACFDRYLARVPAATAAYVARAQLFTDLQEIPLAVADYSHAITSAKQPLPEYYIERSRLECLPKGAGADAALKGLEEGIAKIGPIVTLELPARDLDLAAGRFDAALARVDLLMAAAERKETYLTLRGDIQERAGQPDAAVASYRQALEALANGPERAQTTALSQALKRQLEQRIEQILHPQSAPPPMAPAANDPENPAHRTLDKTPASAPAPADVPAPVAR